MKFNNLSNEMCRLAVLIVIISTWISAEEVTTTSNGTSPSTTTMEPEGVTGCPPPNFKFSRPKVTTEGPFVTFETTQLFLPQTFTTSDVELVGGVRENSHSKFDEHLGQSAKKDTSKLKENPFWFEDIIKDAEEHYNPPAESFTHQLHHHRRNQQRAKRTHHRRASSETLSLIRFDGDDNDKIGRIEQIEEKMLAKRSVEYPAPEEDYPVNEVFSPGEVVGNIFNANDSLSAFAAKNEYDLFEVEDVFAELQELVSKNRFQDGDLISKSSHQRVKRKSGKTTSALNRPKSSSDSKKSSSNRKQHGHLEEEGNYQPESEEDDTEKSKEKDRDSEEIDEPPHEAVFREVTEVRFPAEVGPLGTHRLCKIKCIEGMWQGPLCAAPDQDESGQLKFEPLYKRCVVDNIPQHLLLSYKNVSVTLNWDLPHGHLLQARCEDLGLYKLVGEAKVLCSNGLWAPKLPQCVPTTLLTNFSDDSPPSIRIKVGVGSAAYEPSGVLAVLPGSTLHLDCMYPRRKGSPEWTWTGWFRQYLTGWSAVPEEKASRYRLSIKDVQAQDSGTYTCASPRGLTNSIIIIVAVAQCEAPVEPNPPLSLRLEGLKLGQRAVYRCPMGYILQGTPNATCLASGNFSSPAPTCIPIQCPPLFLEDPHLSLIELNTSAWGRAVFSCSWGYRLSGPSNLECLASGHWSGPIPRCRAIQCLQPPLPSNGKIDGISGSFGQKRYAVGALLTFSCNEGHRLEGEGSIVCTETGFWSHPPPYCRSQCSYPGDPANGFIAPLKFFYDVGDLLTVQCRPGFVEQGTEQGKPPERPKCLNDGLWSAEVSHCRRYEEV